MKITYTNTFRDLLAFQLYHQSRSPVMLLVNSCCLCFMAFIFFQGMPEDPAKGVGLAPRIVATLIFLAIFTPILIAVEFAITLLTLVSRGNKTGHSNYSLTMGEDGFVEETNHARLDYQWPAVRKLVRTRRHIFIYVAQNIAVVIPKRSFHDEAEWQTFHEFCRRKTKPGPAAPGASTA